MKKYNLLILAALLLTGSGCKDYLDEDTTGLLYGENVLATQDGLESALTGAYKGLGAQWSYGFLHTGALGAVMGGDDITTHPASNKADIREFDQFNPSTTNQRSNAVYVGCYKAIQGANNVINNWEKTVGTKATIDIIVGEAHFLRAFSYYWLVRFYGNIPLITVGEYSDELLTVGKSTPQEVYDLIVADLRIAETNLPNLKREPGRANKGAAKAFLAEVYLTMAGWPLKQTDKYDLAAAKAKEVIDDHTAYGFELLPTFAAVFENDPASPGTREAVFQISGFAGGSGTGNAAYGNTAMPGEEGGWDDMFAELNFFRDFPAGPRKDATFRTEFGLGATKIPWQNSLTKHPYYKKWYIKGNLVTSNISLPTVMMRYPHVLTTYAEAKARGTGGPDQTAYDALNQVRLRGLPAGTKPLAMGSLTAAKFADAVVEERAWEFACETTRWFDLVRLEKVEEANAKKSPDDLQPIKAITKASYWFPLPYSDTSINPNLN